MNSSGSLEERPRCLSHSWTLNILKAMKSGWLRKWNASVLGIPLREANNLTLVLWKFLESAPIRKNIENIEKL